jgi:hypothetical protein
MVLTDRVRSRLQDINNQERDQREVQQKMQEEAQQQVGQTSDVFASLEHFKV